MAGALRRALITASSATSASTTATHATITATANVAPSTTAAAATAVTTSPVSRAAMYQAASRHCLSLVRQKDHDGYTATLMAPQRVRVPMITLRAFHAELAAIPTQQRIAAQLRFQWWRNAVMECADKRSTSSSSSQQTVASAASSHPVVTMLGAVMTQYPINPSWLLTMIDAKETATLVNTSAARSMDELFTYADGWTGSLYQSLMEVNGIVDYNAAKHAAYHLGRAVSLCSLLRWVPAHAAQRKCYLPSDLIRQAKLDVNTLFSGQSTRELSDVIFEVASVANHELRAARALQKPATSSSSSSSSSSSNTASATATATADATPSSSQSSSDVIPSSSWPALLPAVQCARFLDRMQDNRFDIYHPTMASGTSWEPLSMRFDLLRHRWQKKY